MAMQQATPPAPTIRDVKPGSRWVDTSARGAGELIQVSRITYGMRDGLQVPLKVQFISLKKGANRNRQLSVPIDIFLTKHLPQAPAVRPPAPSYTRPKQVPLPPRMSNIYSLDTRLTPPTFELGSMGGSEDGGDEPEIEPTGAVSMGEPAQEVVEIKTDSMGRRRTHPRAPRMFTDEQAVEVYLLKDSEFGSSEVARVYDVSEASIRDIWKGINYRAATAHLRGETPAQPTAEEPPVPEEVVVPQTQQRSAGPLPMAVPNYADTRSKHGHPGRPCGIGCVPGHHPAPEVEAESEADILITTMVSEDDKALFRNLAAAVEVLLEHHGKPLPPFFTLDTQTLRGLVSTARIRADS